jgi:ribonuclease P protein component
MLPKSYRVPKDVFSVVRKTGTRIFTPSFQFIVQKNSASSSRIGIIIPKRIIKLAVARNALKRHIREAFQFMQTKFTDTNDVLCFVKQDCTKKSYEDIKKEMHILLEKKS